MNYLVAAFLFATLPALATVAEVPPDFWPRNEHATGPVWTRASEAVSPEGKLIEERLAPADAIKVKYLASKRTSQDEKERCDVALGALIDDSSTPSPARSLAAVKVRAQYGRSISGTITATAVGFYSGAPFTVLQVTPENGPHPFYLLYPRGTIDVNGTRICTNDTRYAAEPQVHDKVLAVIEEAVDNRGRLYRVQPELLFFEKDGDTVLSGHLRGLKLAAEHRFDVLKRDLLAIRTEPGAMH